MKKLHVSFDGITDTTGYLFSLAKCFAAVLNSGCYQEYAEDIIAASGFAFRMWADKKQLCPSATSIWEFRKQKEWFENSGLTCSYVERLWGEDAVQEERRTAAIELIKKSVQQGNAVVSWDISGCEWGIITGYDDDTRSLSTLKVNEEEDSIAYEKLGLLELPILSVLAVSGKEPKEAAQIVADTKKLAAAHLTGTEWCDNDNTSGLAVYDTMISFIKDTLTADTAWNLEYYLGTYAALKWHAWKFFEKYNEPALAQLYQTVYEAWQGAFDVKRTRDVTECAAKTELTAFLSTAKNAEEKAAGLMR